MTSSPVRVNDHSSVSVESRRNVPLRSSRPPRRRSFPLAWFGVIAGLAASVTLHAQGAFTPGAEATVNFDPSRIVSGDFNRDGQTDLAVLHRGRSEISLLDGTAQGRFAAARVLATTTTPIDLFAQEFSADAREDMATVGATIGLSRGNGAGTFGAFARTELGVEVFTAATGDFNEDGRTDVITITGAGLRLLTSTGVRLNVLGNPIPALSAGAAMVVADFNRDRHLDVAFTRFGQSTTIGVMFGNGNGTFQAMKVFITGETPLDLVSADFDRDGHLDVAVLTLSATRPLAILRGDRSGGFLLPDHPRIAKPDQIAVADIDHNGTADVVMLHRTQRRIELLRGHGDGTFAAATELAASIPGTVPIREFAVAELNGDLRPDLAVSVRHPENPNLGLIITFLNPVERAVEGVINVSTRLLVQNGTRAITSFVIEGRPTKVLLRAVGPGLRQLGLSNGIADPNLTIFRGNTTIASNNDWSATPLNRANVEQATTAAGAFPLTVGSKDAATVLTLAPGAYTIVTAPTPGTSGEVMIEVYRADE